MPPGSNRPADPYRVWLSEIMLQQTTVAAVKPYFEAFTTRWPDVAALAAAPEEDVLAAWAGLGYYARARNLIACARAVAEAGGAFPDSEDALRALPGVGAYTAAAIAAIAFGQRAVAVDANVERVVSRLFAITDPLPASRPAIRAAADSITPDARAGDFAQAMMDLGSSICTSREPKCLICPLRRDCAAQAQGIAASLPVKAAKKPKPVRTGTAFWIERGWSGAAGQTGGQGHAGRDARISRRWLGGAARWRRRDPPFAADWQETGAERAPRLHPFRARPADQRRPRCAGRAGGGTGRRMVAHRPAGRRRAAHAFCQCSQGDGGNAMVGNSCHAFAIRRAQALGRTG